MAVSLHKTTAHTVTIDETGTLTSVAAKAFCTCGWSEDRWHHADEFGPDDDEVSAADLAVGAAEDAGADHVITAQQDAAWATRQAARYR